MADNDLLWSTHHFIANAPALAPSSQFSSHNFNLPMICMLSHIEPRQGSQAFLECILKPSERLVQLAQAHMERRQLKGET